jgi:hypothetical protein
MRQTLIKALCSTAAVVAIGVLLLPDAVAKTTPAIKGEQAANEESAPGTQGTRCQDPATCCRPSPVSRSPGIGGIINRFLVSGCKLNYRLTNWMLGDKCMPRHACCGCCQQASPVK